MGQVIVDWKDAGYPAEIDATRLSPAESFPLQHWAPLDQTEVRLFPYCSLPRDFRRKIYSRDAIRKFYPKLKGFESERRRLARNFWLARRIRRIYDGVLEHHRLDFTDFWDGTIPGHNATRLLHIVGSYIIEEAVKAFYDGINTKPPQKYIDLFNKLAELAYSGDPIESEREARVLRLSDKYPEIGWQPTGPIPESDQQNLVLPVKWKA